MALQNRNKQNESRPGQVMRVGAKIIPKINRYYLKISRKYRAAQLVLILAFAAFLVVIITTFGSHITYSNLQYLMRDLDSMITQGESDFSQIRYDKQSEQDFAVFKNGIAAAGKDSFLLFDSTGLQLCRDRISFSDPVLVPSDKYLLLYDMGGKEYSVYNSITRVISRSTDYKIVDGDMSDSGAFILVTRYNESKYAVWYYNAALTQSMRIRKENYVMDTAISKDGKKIVVCSAIPSTTDLDCEISLYQAGDSEFNHTVVIPRTLPLSVRFTDTGFVVLCDNGVYFYDPEGKEVSAAPISGITLEYADLSDDFVVLACSENALSSEHRILVFTKDGTLLADTILGERITGICVPSPKDANTLAYVLTSDSVLRLCTDAAQTEALPSPDANFTWERTAVERGDVIDLCPSQKGVIAFTETSAYYLFN